MFKQVSDEWGTVDVLVNNAGARGLHRAMLIPPAVICVTHVSCASKGNKHNATHARTPAQNTVACGVQASRRIR